MATGNYHLFTNILCSSLAQASIKLAALKFQKTAANTNVPELFKKPVSKDKWGDAKMPQILQYVQRL
jgi:hypothetical protein